VAGQADAAAHRAVRRDQSGARQVRAVGARQVRGHGAATDGAGEREDPRRRARGHGPRRADQLSRDIRGRAVSAMTKKDIDAVLERVRTWPQPRQEDAARLLLAMENVGTAIYELSEEEEADIDAALEEIARGEVASDEEVAAVFNRFRR